MKMSHLAFRGVAALPDLECDFVSPTTGRPHDLIVISGPAASGKTRLCELMLAVFETVGPYLGIVRASDWMSDPVRGARVELDLELGSDGGDGPAPAKAAHAVVSFSSSGVSSEIDRKVTRYLAQYDHDPTHGKREYFPENRQRAWGARHDGLAAHEQALLRSSKDPQKYSFVPRFLAALRTDSTRLRVFASGLELLSPALRYTPATRTGDPTACFASSSRSGVLYSELGSAEADAVLIAATAAMIGLNHSVVFLDRPELYVPTDRLVPWVQSLAQIGVNNQWIVATSDQGLAQAVHRSQLVSLGQGESLGQSSSLRGGDRSAAPSSPPSSWRPA